MLTQAQAHAGPDASYFGDRGDWLIVAETHRDADILTRANYAAICTWLREQGADVETESSSHWAIGWVERALIAPEHVNLAQQISDRLAEYPVFDDMVYSDFEHEHVTEVTTQAVDDFQRVCEDDRADIPRQKLIDAVISAAYESDDSNSPDYYGADEYWPTDEFIAEVASTLA